MLTTNPTFGNEVFVRYYVKRMFGSFMTRNSDLIRRHTREWSFAFWKIRTKLEDVYEEGPNPKPIC
jgi:hypothetical protein